MGGRQLNVVDLMASLKLPVLVTHGTEDRNILVSGAQHTAKTILGAKLSLYDGIGHSPFYEDSPRFNAELAAFAREATRGHWPALTNESEIRTCACKDSNACCGSRSHMGLLVW